MNCIEYRRRFGTEPRENASMREHRVVCARCSEFHASSLGFERSLREALELPAPQGLAEAILLRQTTERRRRPRFPAWLAIAASTILALGLGVALWPSPEYRNDALVQLAIDHYLHEPYALDVRPVVPPPLLRSSAARVGIALDAAPEDVTYAAACPMGPYRTLHLVVRRAGVPVTLFLVPGLDAGERSFVAEGIHSRSVPVPGGTLMAMAEREDLLSQVLADWQGVVGVRAAVAAGRH